MAVRASSLPEADADRLEPFASLAAGDPAAAHLCATVIDLVGERGVDGVSDDLLVARSGTGWRALDRSFGDADGCLVAGYVALTGCLRDRWDTLVAERDGFTEAVSDATARGFVWLSRHPAAARLMVGDRYGGSPALRTARAETRMSSAAQLQGLYTERTGATMPAVQFEVLAGAIALAGAEWATNGMTTGLAPLRAQLDAVVQCFEPALVA